MSDVREIIARAPEHARVSIFWSKNGTSGESVFDLKELKPHIAGNNETGTVNAPDNDPRDS